MSSYKEQTIKVYDENAEELSKKFSSFMELHRRKEFKKLLELVPTGKLLDLGCGSGDHAFFFKEQGLDVTCVDLSEKMIELCRKKGLNAKVMDIEDLKFEDNSFDVVWSVTSLLHIKKENLSKVIEKVHKILKDKGIFYVCVKEGDGEETVDDGRFFVYWQKDDLLKYFEELFEMIEYNLIIHHERRFIEFFFRKI